MKFIIVFFLLGAPFFSANAQTCDRGISWKDASYLKRSTISGAVTSMSEWRHYLNAEWIQMEFDGQVTTMISLKNGIRLLHSKDNIKPIELAEIAMAIESPMWSAGRNMFPSIKIPCQLKDGESTPVSQRDLHKAPIHAHDSPKFFGNLRRQGMRVTYAIEIQRGKSDDQFDRLYGTWEYEANLKNFPDDYDVQGWIIYRGDVLQRQLPIGRRVPISEVLHQY